MLLIPLLKVGRVLESSWLFCRLEAPDPGAENAVKGVEGMGERDKGDIEETGEQDKMD